MCIRDRFLAVQDPLLAKLAGQAEQYFFTDPNICLIRLRQFGEVLAQRVAAQVGVYTPEQDDQLNRLNTLCDRGALTPEVAVISVSYTHLRAHETPEHLVC